jgi:toxin ParE1/3/4
MTIHWTQKAQNDLVSIGLYIKNDNAEIARKFIMAIRKRVLMLKENPGIGRIVPEINQVDIKELIFKNYRFVYKMKSESIDILIVFEGHKLLEL